MDYRGHKAVASDAGLTWPKELGSKQIKAAQCASVLIAEATQRTWMVATVKVRFPFMLLTVLIAFALYKDLAWEFRQRDEKARLLNTRLEHRPLRESEREAERPAEEESHPSTSEEAPTASPGKEDSSETRRRA